VAASSHRLLSWLAFTLALAALAGGAGLMLATCAAGERLLVARFGPDVAAPGRWVARLPAQRLEAGKRIAVDLWLDYSGTGEVSSEVTATSASGDVQRMAKSWTKRSGALSGAFRRAALWPVADPGPWTVDIALVTGRHVQMTYGTAGLTQGAVEGVLPGGIALAVGVMLGLLGFALRG